eukprot:67220_1
MTNEYIDGQCLHDLNKNDLHRFGITHFKDKCDILTAIHELIRNNKSKQFAEKNEKKDANTCVICYDEIPTHICLPCGHFNVCGHCTSKLTGTCPICQNEYESVIKVFHDF